MSCSQMSSLQYVRIGIFGKENVGKSSLFNEIIKQNIATVSPITEKKINILEKAIEINNMGPCLFFDTPNLNLINNLSRSDDRKKIRDLIKKIDIAIILINDFDFEYAADFITKLNDVPKIIAINKIDILEQDYLTKLKKKIFSEFNLEAIEISAKKNINLDALINNLIKIKPYQEKNIFGDLIQENDSVLVIIPKDTQEPQGRLILPHSQIISNLLDKAAIVTCATKKNFLSVLKNMNPEPKLIITGSQIFDFIIENNIPPSTKITSFSILLAQYNGDIQEFKKGADFIDKLKPDSKVLIVEACTHVPIEEDITRIQIPRLLKNYLGFNLKIKFLRGNDFPKDLTEYDLIIHCGACTFKKEFMLARINQAKKQKVNITNYGLAIAKLKNLLDRIYFQKKI